MPHKTDRTEEHSTCTQYTTWVTTECILRLTKINSQSKPAREGHAEWTQHMQCYKLCAF